MMVAASRAKRAGNRAILPRKVKVQREKRALQREAEAAADGAGDGQRKRRREASAIAAGEQPSGDGVRPRRRRTAYARGVATASDDKQLKKMDKMVRRQLALQARQGESDRRIYTKMPVHLISGKRGIGKTDRR